MKRLLIVMSIVILYAVSVSAQNVKPFSFYGGAGLSVPAAPDGFSEKWKAGYHLSGGIGFKVAPSLQIIGIAEFHVFPKDIDPFLEFLNIPEQYADDIEGGTYSVFTIGIEGSITLNLPNSSVKPYGRFGFGVAVTEISDLEYENITFLAGADENRPYLSFTGGLEFVLNPGISLFFQGRVVAILYDDEKSRISDEVVTFIPLTMGLKF